MLHGSPWIYTHSHCHQLITQQQPKGPRGSLEVTPECDSSANQCRPENGPVLTHREGDLGKTERASGTPSLVRGSIWKKKVEWV